MQRCRAKHGDIYGALLAKAVCSLQFGSVSSAAKQIELVAALSLLACCALSLRRSLAALLLLSCSIVLMHAKRKGRRERVVCLLRVLYVSNEYTYPFEIMLKCVRVCACVRVCPARSILKEIVLVREGALRRLGSTFTIQQTRSKAHPSL